MAVTQKQIAQELGVSHQLVSFALNGGGTIAAKTRQEIVIVAERMGYRRNELARAMATGKSSILGLLSHESDQSDHLMRVLAGTIDTANENGYFIKAMHYSRLSDLRGVLERCIEWRVGGLMVMNLMDDAMDFVEVEAKRMELPVVFVENQPREAAEVWVGSDDCDGLSQILDHLIKLGHSKIGFFNGDAGNRLTRKRDTHFRRLMAKAGLEVNEAWVVSGHWSGATAENEAAAQTLLSCTLRPTAVICAGDPMAMVMLRAAQNAGLKLPEQLSITGFANFFLSELSNPALTTVDQSFRVMGRVAVQTLIALTSPAETIPSFQRQLVPTRLIVRYSTAPPAL